MTEGISIDFGSALPYLEDKVRAWIGQDAASQSARDLLDKHLRLAVRDAATVQIVGMDRPVSIFDVYQPTRLTRSRTDDTDLKFGDLLSSRDDAVILGGPGSGKTVFTHFVFAQLARSKEYLPLLFTLRWPGASRDLAKVIEHLKGRRVATSKKRRLILLVDGYDEVATKERQRLAAVLREYSALDIGNFYLTCRSFYELGDVKAPRFEIAPFTNDDAVGFVEAFAKAYKADIRASALLSELQDRGFGGFTDHPLMLALVCILKSGPMPTLPRTSIGLIRRAIDTLTFRWDEAKGVYRESRLNIDGDDRIRCMMYIAYGMGALVEPDRVVLQLAAEFLERLQRTDIRAEGMLDEIAQWYGMLVPASDQQWTFVHRTIHDYLAARLWVEMGKFTPAAAAQHWSARAAYAACLLSDATPALSQALAYCRDIGPFVECLLNGAAFDTGNVATAVVEHFARHSGTFRVNVTESSVNAITEQDFFAHASDAFVMSLITAALSGQSDAHQLVLAYSLDELHRRRGLALNAALANQLRQKLGRRTLVVRRAEVDVEFDVESVLRRAGA